jgi:hypothetical protein
MSAPGSADKPGAGAPVAEIEVTPAMLEAGVTQLWELQGQVESTCKGSISGNVGRTVFSPFLSVPPTR